MDSLVIYLIIGVVWIFQILAKKREGHESTRAPENQNTRGEEYPCPPWRESASSWQADSVGPELEEPVMVVSQPEEISQVVLPEPQVEIQSAGHGFSVSDLSDDVFEQGIILSAVLGPPRSAVYLQQAYRQR